MNIEIKYVKDAGNKAKERIILKARADLDIGNYILFDTTYFDNGSVSNKIRHSIWFPDTKIGINDLVIVYTKIGEYSFVKNKNNTKSHFFYMGLDTPIWNQDGDCAVIVEVNEWLAKKMMPIPEKSN